MLGLTTTMPNFWLIFTTGLLTGGLTCLAVQGGLLATLIGQKSAASQSKNQNATPIFLFLAAKLFAYTILGFFLGWLGSFFQFSLAFRAVLTAAVAVFMLGTALALLDVHPIFRYFIIQPPKFLTRIVRDQSKSKSIFGPVILGAMTIFVPCGTTQAMMALAMGTGSAALGAVIMFAFILGTTPLFFILGYGASRLGTVFQKPFRTVTAAVIVLISVYSLNSALIMSGSSWSLDGLAGEAYCAISFCHQATVAGAQTEAPNNEVTVNITASGYSTDHEAIAAGKLVTMHLINTDGRGCQQSFMIPKLGISRIVRPGQSATIQFTAPDQPGELTFNCSMGMFRGSLRVI